MGSLDELFSDQLFWVQNSDVEGILHVCVSWLDTSHFTSCTVFPALTTICGNRFMSISFLHNCTRIFVRPVNTIIRLTWPLSFNHTLFDHITRLEKWVSSSQRLMNSTQNHSIPLESLINLILGVSTLTKPFLLMWRFFTNVCETSFKVELALGLAV